MLGAYSAKVAVGPAFRVFCGGRGGSIIINHGNRFYLRSHFLLDTETGKLTSSMYISWTTYTIAI